MENQISDDNQISTRISTRKQIYFSILWANLFSLFITLSLHDGLTRNSLGSPQFQFTFFSLLFLIINAVVSIIIDHKFIFLRKWYSLLLVYVTMALTYQISDSIPGLSSVANLGYGNIAPAEILWRGIFLGVCLVIIDKMILPIFPEANRSEAKVISRIISVTLFILYSVMTTYYFSLLT